MDPKNEAPDLVDLLREVAVTHCSDLHLTTGRPPSFRKNGNITPGDYHSIDSRESREMVLGVLNENQRAELEKNRELNFGVQIRGVGRFRGNAHYSRGSLEATFRFIPATIPALSEIGLRPTVYSLCDLSRGLILVTGSTGSGKTTSIASMVKHISEQRAGVIITVEDPIEYYFENARSIIKQREVGIDTLSYSQALDNILRQDPDVVVVGELRDQETVRATLKAAETGHLVISTLHTMDAPQALDRILDFFPGNEQKQILSTLADSLAAIIAQRLIPQENSDRRVLVSEMLISTAAVRRSIREHNFAQLVGMMEAGRKDGMYTIDEMLEDLYVNGMISKEEAVAGARDPARMEVLRRLPSKSQ
jgi:twitching motility protein PilT